MRTVVLNTGNKVAGKIRLRKGSSADNDWLFDLFRQTMREYIDQVWGWNEMFQREAFLTHLPGKAFQILELDGAKVGGYQLKDKSDHLWLEMILLYPALQRQGYGSLMLEQMKRDAVRAGLPLRLACLRCNPAWEFYQKQEFRIYDEDVNSFMMVWLPRQGGPA